MADLPYARVRTWHNLHLINNTRPVRLLRKVHGQVAPIGIDGFKIEETDVIKVECTLTYRQNSLLWCLFFLIMMMISSMVCSLHTCDSSYTVVRHRTPLVGRGHHAGFDVNFVSHRDLLARSGLVSHESQNLHMNVSYPVRSAFPLPVGLNVKVMQAISVKLKI